MCADDRGQSVFHDSAASRTPATASANQERCAGRRLGWGRAGRRRGATHGGVRAIGGVVLTRHVVHLVESPHELHLGVVVHQGRDIAQQRRGETLLRDALSQRVELVAFLGSRMSHARIAGRQVDGPRHVRLSDILPVVGEEDDQERLVDPRQDLSLVEGRVPVELHRLGHREGARVRDPFLAQAILNLGRDSPHHRQRNGRDGHGGRVGPCEPQAPDDLLHGGRGVSGGEPSHEERSR